jgi:uncharacterized protein YuzE
MTVSLTLGMQVGYAYLLPKGTPVARTVEVSDDVMVDVDDQNRPIGVETLDGSDWPAALVSLAMRGKLRVA